MASEDLQAFLASMSAGGSRAALESYDLDALGRLDDPEQDEAVAACVTKIASGQNDPRAVAVLDHLFRFESEATLRETMERIPGMNSAILFLLEVRNRPADFRALLEVSQEGTRGGRIDASRTSPATKAGMTRWSTPSWRRRTTPTSTCASRRCCTASNDCP